MKQQASVLLQKNLNITQFSHIQEAVGEIMEKNDETAIGSALKTCADRFISDSCDHFDHTQLWNMKKNMIIIITRGHMKPDMRGQGQSAFHTLVGGAAGGR